MPRLTDQEIEALLIRTGCAWEIRYDPDWPLTPWQAQVTVNLSGEDYNYEFFSGHGKTKAHATIRLFIAIHRHYFPRQRRS